MDRRSRHRRLDRRTRIFCSTALWTMLFVVQPYFLSGNSNLNMTSMMATLTSLALAHVQHNVSTVGLNGTLFAFIILILLKLRKSKKQWLSSMGYVMADLIGGNPMLTEYLTGFTLAMLAIMMIHVRLNFVSRSLRKLDSYFEPR